MIPIPQAFFAVLLVAVLVLLVVMVNKHWSHLKFYNEGDYLAPKGPSIIAQDGP
jgi:hypothetical protein